MRAKMSRTKSTNTAQPTLECMLADAVDHGLMQVVGALTPRQYVALQTMSPFEIGHRFKQLLRDELHERRRGGMRGQQNRRVQESSR
ncbi:hypothetical protein WM03_11990 [Burkholderia ubonensis]|nr:hypothetical protein WJ65_19860 [Burkholderia ubonensis]KWI23637.1 hypothetical protein WM02_29250 [Burkholderia ubonensis]KWI31432.1 hypothetical protein WM03_11990 [Burkholderia ubonensis]ODQ24026.1 hypothetical protein BGV63_29450 [Burkholderia ubonensis]OJA25708.1 hypothetical protein BGV58_23085 [Burkholderia ubonensis]